MYNQTFNEVKNELNAFRSRGNLVDQSTGNAVSETSSAEEKPKQIKEEDPYHVIGKEWEAPLGGAPYPNVKLEADRTWKMPGSRQTMKDQIDGMGKKYWLVYNNFLKMFICGAGAFLSFFVMGGLAVYLGIIFVIGIGMYFAAYFQHLETVYSIESNWGTILPIGAERDYLVKSKWSGLKPSKK